MSLQPCLMDRNQEITENHLLQCRSHNCCLLSLQKLPRTKKERKKTKKKKNKNKKDKRRRQINKIKQKTYLCEFDHHQNYWNYFKKVCLTRQS